MEERKAGFEIVIAGRSVKWPRNEIKYEEVKEEWDKLSPDRTVVGDPPIHYKRENGEKGILLPARSSRSKMASACGWTLRTCRREGDFPAGPVEEEQGVTEYEDLVRQTARQRGWKVDAQVNRILGCTGTVSKKGWPKRGHARSRLETEDDGLSMKAPENSAVRVTQRPFGASKGGAHPRQMANL